MPEPGTIPVLTGLAVSWGNNIKQGNFSERAGGGRCSRDVLSKGRGGVLSCPKEKPVQLPSVGLEDP